MIFLLFSILTFFPPMEICDNGIDDDGDGLIDYQDDDCKCTNSGFEEIFIIPNPQFDDNLECCGSNLEPGETCLGNWEVLGPTPDYINQDCSPGSDISENYYFDGYEDGNGFIFCAQGYGESEVIGTCFSEPLEINYSYEISFDVYVSAKYVDYSEFPYAYSIYGVLDCGYLTSVDVGNLCNDPQIVELATDPNMNEYVSTGMQTKTFKFVADRTYEAFFFDLSCSKVTFEEAGNVMFFDNFIIKKSLEPFQIVGEEGSLCNQTLVLRSPLNSSFSYQWYLDGVAIAGATSEEYMPDDFGDYLLVATNIADGACVESLLFTIDESYKNIYRYTRELICHGDSIEFFGEYITDAGVHEHVSTTGSICDTVHLLHVYTSFIEAIAPEIAIFFPGFSMVFGNQLVTMPGIYYDTIATASGCDSLPTLLVVDPFLSENCTNLIDDDNDGLIDALDPDCNCTSPPSDKQIYATNPCATPTTFYIDFEAQNIQWYDNGNPLIASNTDSIHVNISNFNQPFQLAYYEDGNCFFIESDKLIANTIEVFDTIYRCETEVYTFFSQTIDTTGSYSHFDLLDNEGCDTVFYLEAIFYPSKEASKERQICAGEVYIFNGVNLNSTGTYFDTLQTAAGCDSILSLELSVIDAFRTDLEQQVCNGEVYNFNGVNLNTAGTYFDTLQTTAGCDSILSLELAVIDVFRTDLEKQVCTGEVYDFNGVNLNSTGTYFDTLQTAAGCDSILSLELSVIDAFRTDLEQQVCNGEVYNFNGVNLNTAGTYFDTLQTTAGCDSILSLELAVIDVFRTDLEKQVCTGEVYDFNGVNLNSAGTYFDTLQTTAGCDSILSLELAVIDVFRTDLEKQVCTGEVYDFNGVNLNSAGTYFDTLQTAAGCDSILSLELAVIDVFRTDLEKQVCNGEVYDFNGVNLNTAGTYFDTLQTAAGCDSILSLELAVIDVFRTDLEKQVCTGEVYDFNGVNLNSAGTYFDTLQTAAGCDSILSLELSVIDVFRIDLEKQVCAGEVYNFNGVNLNSAGTYFDTLQTAAGCDSILSLELSVIDVFRTDLEQQVCTGEVYDFNGINLNSAGTYFDTLQTAAGCDSILSLELSVIDAFRTDLEQQVCTGEVYDFNGVNLNSAGTYFDTLQTAAGCDSILSLELSVIDAFRTDIEQQVCTGEVYDFNGVNLNTAGTYFDTLQTAAGCDSILSLELSVIDAFRTDLEQQVCTGEVYNFNGINLNSAGTYFDTLQTAAGCDSILSLELTEMTSPEIFYNQGFCVEEDLLTPFGVFEQYGNFIVNIPAEAGCDTIVHIALSESPLTIGDTVFFTLKEETIQIHDEIYEEPGLYELILTNEFGCDSLIYISISEKIESAIFLPNVIKHSSTSGNNTFQIFGNKNIIIKNFSVYDRWGSKVFSASNYTISDQNVNAFNGLSNGSKLAIGVYIYQLQYASLEDDEIKTVVGNVTLID